MLKEKVVTRRYPELVEGGRPVWLHRHGDKMQVEKFDKQNSLLVISGSAASLRITRAIPDKNTFWYLNWEVVRSQNEGVSGKIAMGTGALQAAFGLSEDWGRFGNQLHQQYGAHSAEQGKYIRWNDFLNIPSPGTGHDGDPNISILLTGEIQEGVRQLLL